MYTNEAKLYVLNKILAKKHILFGKFSNTLTKNDKVSAWKEIFEQCQCLNCFEGKDYTYIRDVFYHNLKKSAVAKRDAPTGKEGGRKAKYTEVDEKVFDIMGRETPGLIGMNVQQSRRNLVIEESGPSTPRRSPRLVGTSPLLRTPTQTRRPLALQREHPSVPRTDHTGRRKANSGNPTQSKADLKMDLQISVLKKMDRLMDLKITHMEYVVKLDQGEEQEQPGASAERVTEDCNIEEYEEVVISNL